MSKGNLDVLNEYVRNARLKPALLAGLPLGMLAASLGLSSSVLLAALSGPLAIAGVTYFLAHLSRDWGVRKQVDLFRRWGGKPSVSKLRHRDNSLNQHTRARYHAKGKELLGYSMPTAAAEAADPAAADSLYEAYSNLLLERTRDTKVFRLLFEELIGYGFRRNLLGMRFLGLTIAIVSSVFQSALLLRKFHVAGQIEISQAVFLGVDLLLLLCWLFVITPSWVRHSAEAYGERLLAASEGLSATGATRGSKPAKSPRRNAKGSSGTVEPGVPGEPAKSEST